MKKLIALFVIGMILGVGMATLPYAGAEMIVADSKTVTGDLLKIEGGFHVVKDMTGREVKVHIDQTTQRDDAIKVGDRIEVQVGDKDHAVSVKHVKPTS